MGIVDRPAPDEPEEKPDQLGRHLLRIMRDHPGEWREAYEADRRETAVRIEGCLIGRGVGRIAGVTDITGWEARLVTRRENQKEVHVVRVRYTPPKAEKDPTMEKLRSGQQVVSDPDPEPEVAGESLVTELDYPLPEIPDFPDAMLPDSAA